MNLLIETLNLWADHAIRFAWPMLWQSSLLIGVLFALDLLLRRKLRPAVRYALWLVVLVKLLLPPSLAFPTSAGWWLRPGKVAPARPRPTAIVVTYDATPTPVLPTAATPAFAVPSRPLLTPAAWAFVGMVGVGLALLAWMLARWRVVAREAHRAAVAPGWVNKIVPELPHPARLRLTDYPQSPAVCGLFRPVLLLPRSLVEQLPPAQLRAVLLHELFHLRRGDVWVNCAQALLQIVYWWHPLLWLANARIRLVREEAVDDAVMLALSDDAETYAPTLLEVAKLALHRPLASLGLVGILESRSSLRQRIERLIDFRPPRQAGLSAAALIGVLGFAALAVPMGEAPAPTASSGSSAAPVVTNSPSSQPSSDAGLVLDQKARVSRLVQDGKLLYEMNKLDQAEAKLKLALKEDPQNQAAHYYLNLISEARFGRARAQLPDKLPIPNPYARTNLVHASQGRQAIIRRLERIRLDSVSFDGQPLSDVVRRLADESRKRDPENIGVNFLLKSAASANTPGDDHLEAWTGLRKSGASTPAVELPSLPITIQPALTNLRLADVLDAIVKVAGRPIKYSIEDYAVVFSDKTNLESPPLYVRSFKVDLNTLFENLHVPKSPVGTNGLVAVMTALRDCFAKAGVDLGPPKTLYCNEGRGMLIVRATLQDLDTVEQVIATLNAAPAQINIKAKFVEVSQDDVKALGLDWHLGIMLMTNSPTGGHLRTAPPANGAPSAANPVGIFPGNPSSGTNRQPLNSGPRPAGSSPATLTGILTEPQYRMALKALQQRDGTELVAQPQVTVNSGRQAQCKAVEVRSVVEGIDARALTPPGITSTNEDENAVYKVEQMEFGPVLDIFPTVLPDGCTVNLVLVGSLLEFLGYEDNRTNRVTVYVNGKPKQVNPPQPHFRNAQITSQVNVWDGQTLVLGGLVSESSIAENSGVPVLSNLPGLGPLFRSESKNTRKRNLLVFITPTIIDPAGNRVHSDEEMPFSRDAVPGQPAR